MASSDLDNAFSGHLHDGMFDWQLTANPTNKTDTGYDETQWWGGFPKEILPGADRLPDWAIGPFTKHPRNPVLSPTPGGWDCGRYSGGVHNGSILICDDQFYFVYRGERPLSPPINGSDYICDIGLATSPDGVAFTKDTQYSPFFRGVGDNARYSYEDVCIARHGDTFYLFCNQWDWARHGDPRVSGAWLATSKDLKHCHSSSAPSGRSVPVPRPSVLGAAPPMQPPIVLDPRLQRDLRGRGRHHRSSGDPSPRAVQGPRS